MNKRGFMRFATAIIAGLTVICGMGNISAIAGNQDELTNVKWYDVSEWNVEGKGWQDTEDFFDRLPFRAQKTVNSRVWQLSKCSAGMTVRFISDSASIHIRYKLVSSSFSMPHMPTTGVSGVDLYLWDDKGGWKWVNSGGKSIKSKEVKQRLVRGLPGGKRMYQLYLPLYNGVELMELGFEEGSFVEPVSSRSQKPIVFYGGSMVQGACASRPGMCHSAILGRRLGKPVINLGFSGQGGMMPEEVDLLKELDACAYVVDSLGNMAEEIVMERTLFLVKSLRQARPDTPIVLVELRPRGNEFVLPNVHKVYEGRREKMRQAYNQLISEGVQNLYLLPGKEQIGGDGEATVDGGHPTDLGFMRIADVFEEFLKPIIEIK
jgi:hypothetical protein